MSQTASNRLMIIVCFILTYSLPNLVSSFRKAPECEIKNHPYVAALTRIANDGRYYHYGAAVLITNEWVMTSENKAIEDYGNGTDPKSYVVLAGSNFELPTSETRNQSRYIKALHSFESYVKAKLVPLFLNDLFTNSADRHVYLIKVDRPFVLNDYVRPVKLPQRPDFVESCGNRTLIVGGGQDYQDTVNDEHWKSVKDPERHHLKCAETSGTVRTPSDDSTFSVEAHNSSIYFCVADKSIPIICQDTLIGFVYSTIDPSTESDDSCYSGYLIKNINISYRITFLHDLTGVQVAFESHPKSFDNPLREPPDVASTSTGMFEREPAITFPPDFEFIMDAAAEKSISCSLWMILTWTMVVFKIVKCLQFH